MKRSKILALLMAICMTLSLVACGGGEKADEKVESAPDAQTSTEKTEDGVVWVPVGGVLSTTGGGASVAGNEKTGIEYAIKVINEEMNGLTIDGTTYKFKLVSYDDGSVAADSVSCAQRLVEEDGISNMIFGSGMSTTTLACLEYLEDAGVPIMTVTSNPHITEDYEYGLRNKTDTTDQARVMTQFFLQEKGCETVCVIAQNNDWGRSGAEQLTKQWEAAGGTVLSVQYIDPNAGDYTTEITNVKAQNPDFVYNISLQADGSIIAKQFHEAGIDALYATVDDVMCEYTVGDYLYWHDAGYTEEMEAVKAGILAEGKDCTIFSMFGYDAMMLTYQAMEEAGTVYDADAIIAAMKASEGSKYTCMGKGFVWDENGQLKMDMYLIKQLDAEGNYEGAWCAPADGSFGYDPS